MICITNPDYIDDDNENDGKGTDIALRQRDITRTSRNWVAACYEFIVSLLISSAGELLASNVLS